MLKFLKPIFLVIVCSLPLLAQSAINPYTFKSLEDEARFTRLTEELRCLVCQNQSLADSNAELALDLRQQVYSMMKQGATDQEIIDYMVQRYGDFVLYRPPVKTTTYLLWSGPFILMFFAAISLIIVVRKRSQTPETDLSETEQERLKKLLDNKEGKDQE